MKRPAFPAKLSSGPDIWYDSTDPLFMVCSDIITDPDRVREGEALSRALFARRSNMMDFTDASALLGVFCTGVALLLTVDQLWGTVSLATALVLFLAAAITWVLTPVFMAWAVARTRSAALATGLARVVPQFSSWPVIYFAREDLVSHRQLWDALLRIEMIRHLSDQINGGKAAEVDAAEPVLQQRRRDLDTEVQELLSGGTTADPSVAA